MQQITDDDNGGNYLSDDGGNGRSRHSPVESHHKKRVENRIDDCACQVTYHRHLRTAVGTDQMTASGRKN